MFDNHLKLPSSPVSFRTKEGGEIKDNISLLVSLGESYFDYEVFQSFVPRRLKPNRLLFLQNMIEPLKENRTVLDFHLSRFTGVDAPEVLAEHPDICRSGEHTKTPWLHDMHRVSRDKQKDWIQKVPVTAGPATVV